MTEADLDNGLLETEDESALMVAGGNFFDFMEAHRITLAFAHDPNFAVSLSGVCSSGTRSPDSSAECANRGDAPGRASRSMELRNSSARTMILSCSTTAGSDPSAILRRTVLGETSQHPGHRRDRQQRLSRRARQEELRGLRRLLGVRLDLGEQRIQDLGAHVGHPRHRSQRPSAPGSEKAPQAHTGRAALARMRAAVSALQRAQ